MYAGYFVPTSVDPSGLCVSCGPDVTDWFSRQLGVIKAFATQHSYTSDKFRTLARTMKFEDAGLEADCGPSGNVCANTVTICGKCINVTELGNIAYGYSLSNESIDVMLFGGLFAEVTTGRGFDSQSDVTAAIAGNLLGSPNNICASLTSPPVPNIWGQGVIINSVSVLNDAYYAYSLLPFGPAPIDVLQEWDNQHGDWDSFLTEAFQALNPDTQFNPDPPPARTLWDTISVETCPVSEDCALPSSVSDIQISSNGTVSW